MKLKFKLVDAHHGRHENFGRAASLFAVATLLAAPAYAQTAPSAKDSAKTEDIIVTGSRLKSSFNQPTPVVAQSAADLAAAQPAGIALALTQLPQFAGAQTSRSLPTSSPTQLRGSYLDLRGLGASRTLILEDGDRLPPTSFDGLVDVETLPELLVSRVDVVTAGVSSVYGSDAVSGVVNYIIDDKFTGLKLTGETGVSTYDDAGRYKLGVAGGMKFAGGRGHLMFSAETEHNNEITYADRPEFTANYGYGGTGTAANPFVLRNNVVWGSITTYPNIVFGPFVGNTFNAAGMLIPDNPGTSINAAPGTGQIGGTGNIVAPGRSLLTGSTSTRLFGRASYDLTNKISAFVEGSYARNKSPFHTAINFAQFLPLNGNPYLLAAGVGIPTAFVPNGSPIGFGIFSTSQFGDPTTVETSDAWRVKAGLKGELFSGWNFRAIYEHGEVHQHVESHEFNMQHLYASLDTVSTANGPACYVSTLANNPLPGCLPYNPYGQNLNGANTAGLASWLFGTSIYDVTNKLDVFSANLNGSPVSTWAGPVSVSVGVEYRKNNLVRTSNSDPNVPFNTFNGAIRDVATATAFGITNIGVINGSNNVKEANLEVLVPIAKKSSPIGEVSITGAGRWTDYSTSGTVYTWKAGGIWQPMDAIRFRITRSRDIRAPNLFELYAGKTIGFQNFSAPAPFNIASGNILVSGGGNAALKPEVANTLTFGVVVSPIHKLKVSVDYYDLSLAGAIQSPAYQSIVADCASSGFTAASCANITLMSGGSPTAASVGTSPTIASVFSGPINLATLSTRGIDIEGAYTVPVQSGQITLRANANVLLSFKSQSNASSPVVSQAGYYDTGGSLLLQDSIQPKLRGTVSAQYASNGGFTIYTQARYVGSLKLGSVPGLAAGQTNVFADNKINAVWYFDANISQTIKMGSSGRNLELFANINNLFNRRPPVIPNDQQPSDTFPTYAPLYDIMGRYFTVGATVRF